MNHEQLHALPTTIADHIDQLKVPIYDRPAVLDIVVREALNAGTRELIHMPPDERSALLTVMGAARDTLTERDQRRSGLGPKSATISRRQSAPYFAH